MPPEPRCSIPPTSVAVGSRTARRRRGRFRQRLRHGRYWFNGLPHPQRFPAPFRGPDDGFVAELNPSLFGGASLVYSSYLGGSGFDIGSGIAVDGSGNAYITGVTTSTNFPTKNPFQAQKKAGNGPRPLRDQDHGKLRPCQVATNPRADDGPETAHAGQKPTPWTLGLPDP